MTVVVADTSPLNYLIQIDEADLLQKLYETIAIPSEVMKELNHPEAPPAVGEWIKRRPSWLQIRPVGNHQPLPELSGLGAGERAAI